MPRYCCVVGCHNNDGIVKEWEAETCMIHNVINGTEQCDCKLPFFLLTFPTKDIKLRDEWTKRINRKNWKPTYETRICSIHFADVDLVKRKTSPQHPCPTLNMSKTSLQESQPNESKDAFQCGNCDATFPQIDLVRVHRLVEHGRRDLFDTNGIYSCIKLTTNEADSASSEDSNLKDEEVEIVNDEKQFDCILCGKTIVKQQGPKLERVSYTLYNCGCGMTYGSDIVTYDDAPRKKERPLSLTDKSQRYMCTYCNKTFIAKNQLYWHMKIHNRRNPVVCDKCGLICANNEELSCHMGNHAKVGVKQRRRKPHLDSRAMPSDGIITGYNLPENNNPTSDKENTEQDKRTSDTRHICDVCGAKYAHKLALTIHMRMHNTEQNTNEDKTKEDIDENKLTCHMENHAKVGVNQRKRKQHLESRAMPSDEIITEDNLPEYNYPSTSDKENTEQDRMTSNTRHKCNICGAKYAHKLALTIHMRMHNTGQNTNEDKTKEVNDKSNVIQDTDEIYNGLDTCISSKRQCTDENSVGLETDENNVRQDIENNNVGQKDDENFYKCDVCNKYFFSGTDLKKHFLMHTGEKLFECTFCGKGFSKKANMKKHEKKHSSNKSYNCDVCSKSFTLKTVLQRHMLIHTGEKPFVCSLCGKAFCDKANMITHEKRHIGEKPHKCQICGRAFLFSHNLKVHLNAHSVKKPFACKFCGKTFHKKSIRYEHERRHKGKAGGLFKCTICEESFSERSDLKPHMNEVHSDINECTVCSKVLSSKYYLIEHMRIHTAERPFKCTLCSKSFSMKSTLRNHERRHNGSSGGLFKCTKCEQSFSERSDVKTHRLKEHPDNKCALCSKTFARFDSLVEHTKTAHVKETQPCKQHKCMVCSKTFTCSSHLKEHTRRHTGERPFICAFCPEKFAYKKTLNSHEVRHIDKIGLLRSTVCEQSFSEGNDLKRHQTETHPDLDQYKCTVCLQTFGHLDLLRDHIRIHTAEENIGGLFNCTACEQSFSERSDLKRHQTEVHPDLDQYKCTVCSKVLCNRYYLAEHIVRVHTEERPFKCTLCPKTFSMESLLHIHIRGHNDNTGALSKCTECQQSFLGKGDLKVHMKESHPDISRHQCTVCSKKFILWDRLRDHMRIHTGEIPFKCTLCPKTFSMESALHSHMRMHTGDRLECRFCPATFFHKTTLNRHERRHIDKVGLFKCTVCEQSFSETSELKFHQKEAHPDLDQYKCTVCFQTFKSSNHLRDHMATHTEDRPFKCTNCPQTFHSESMLTLHMREHTGEKPIQCSKCPKSFTSRLSLTLHACMKTQTGENPFACKNCSRSFTSIGDLACHVKTCEGDVCPLQCMVCNKSFKSQLEMCVHLTSHSANKLFFCGICRGSFGSEFLLKQHMLMHKNNRTYASRICKRTFINSGFLDRHMKLHRTKKPYSCNVCNKSFMFQSNLQVHLMTHVARNSSSRTMQTLSGAACNKTSTSDLDLKLHVASHTENENHSQQELIPNSNQDLNSQMDSENTMTGRSADEQFKCAVCDVSFTSQDLLIGHTCVIKNALYQCYVCKAFCQSLDALTAHMKTHNYEKCSMCEVFAPPDELEDHMKTHSKMYMCVSCARVFDTQVQLNEHMKTHGTPLKDENKMCGETLENKGIQDMYTALQGNEEQLLGEPSGAHIACTKCYRCFTANEELKDHACEQIDDDLLKYRERVRSLTHVDGCDKQPDMNGKEKKFPCQKCGRHFPTEAALISHELNGHKTDSKLFLCTNGNKLDTSENLKDHICKEIEENPEKCKMCPRSFKTKTELEEHVKVHYAVEKFTCKICQKHFSTQAALDSHGVVHKAASSIALFKCIVCGKLFVEKNDIIQHAKIHEKPHQCVECNKLFPSKYGLHRHMQRYEGKPHGKVCNVCGIEFDKRKALERHMIVHKKPYHCKSCNNRFETNEELSEHACTNTSAKENNLRVISRTFNCTVCKEQFKTKALLSKHTCKSESTDGSNPKQTVQAFRCSVCKKLFETKDKLSGHKCESANGKKSLPVAYKCNICKQLFPSLNEVSEHMKRYMKQTSTKGQACDQKLSNNLNLEQHEETSTVESPRQSVPDLKVFTDTNCTQNEITTPAK